MVEYTIIKATSREDLEKDVRYLIEYQWKPLGPPSIHVNQSDVYYYFEAYQTMVRDCYGNKS